MRERAGASALPHPTVTQFLLLWLMLGSASLFAATWWGVLETDGWIRQREDCLRRAASDGAALGETSRCLRGLLLAESAVTVLGPVVLLTLVGLAVVTATARRRWRWRRDPMPVPASTAEAFDACLTEAGFPAAGRPSLVVERGLRHEAFAYGLWGRYQVVVSAWGPLSGMTGRLAEDRIARATLRHEIGHLRARDVVRSRFALHAAWIFPVCVVVPLAGAALVHPGDLALALSWRLAAVTAAVLLAFVSVVRIREYEADAASAASPHDPDGMAAALRVSAGRHPGRRRFVPRWHPDEPARLRALAEPGRLRRLTLASCLVTGTAIGVGFHEVALVVGAVVPGGLLCAYWLTGLAAGAGLAGVVAVSVWRDLEHRRRGGVPGRPSTAVPGAVLGLALSAGTLLSPRAAASWQRMFPTALAPGGDLGVLAARLPLFLLLAAGAVAGGIGLLRWIRAVGGTAVPSGRRGLALIALVAAVPLGMWFLLQRLFASDASASAVAGLLQHPAVLGSLLATGVVAVAVLWRTSGGRPRSHGVAALVAVVLLPGAVAGAGEVVDRLREPGPPLTGPPPGNPPRPVPLESLPLVAGEPGRDPANACWIVDNTPAERLRTRSGLAEVAHAIRNTRDAGLRSIARRISTGLATPSPPPGGFDMGTAVGELHSACQVVLTRDTQNEGER